MKETMERTQDKERKLEGELLRQQQEAAVNRADAYLSQFSHLHERIKRQISTKERLQELANRTTGDPFAPPPAADGTDGRTVAMHRAVDLEREIDRQIDHLYDLKDEICHVLAQIEKQDAALILNDIYIGEKPIRRVAMEEDYSTRYVYKLRRSGLLEVDRILAEKRPMRGYVSAVG